MKKAFNLEDYRKVPCELWKDQGEFMYVYRHTNCRPCIACGFYKNGQCKGYIELSKMYT